MNQKTFTMLKDSNYKAMAYIKKCGFRGSKNEYSIGMIILGQPAFHQPTQRFCKDRYCQPLASLGYWTVFQGIKRCFLF